MNTILFGNGLNYLSKNFISWKTLLDKIKGDNLFENGKLPNTMIYERSIIGNPISFDTLTQKEGAIKREIAEMLENFPSNIFYQKLADIKAENYLTTNYDYAALSPYLSDPSLDIRNKSTEDLYSIRRHKEVWKDGIVKSKIWHIHGEIDTPASIMLGLDHYCGSVGKIDAYVKGRYEFTENKKVIKTPSIIDKLNEGVKFDGSSWVELFFNSKVFIIGLGLDYSEIDLWWILNKRARFLLDNKTRKLVKNDVIFFTTDDDMDQCDLLKTLEVKIVKVPLGKNETKYEEAYEAIFNQIIKNKTK